MLRSYIICMTGCTVWLHGIPVGLLEKYWCILDFKWYNIMILIVVVLDMLSSEVHSNVPVCYTN